MIARLLGALGLSGVLGCVSPELPLLPVEAAAEGVVITRTQTQPFELRLARAEGDLVAGTPVTATTTVAKVAAKAGPPLEITADRSSWDLKTRAARFFGNVTVTRGDVVMHCNELAVAYADADTLDRVVATGGVRVERGARQAQSDRAELVAATGEIALTGSPRLSEGPNALVGNRIVLWLDSEKADCEGAAGSPCKLVVEPGALGR